MRDMQVEDILHLHYQGAEQLPSKIKYLSRHKTECQLSANRNDLHHAAFVSNLSCQDALLVLRRCADMRPQLLSLHLSTWLWR